MTLAPNGHSASTNPVMNVFNIPDALAEKYHGAGHALAASAIGEIIEIVYLRDLLPEIHWEEAFLQHEPAILLDARLGPTVRYLSGLGDVHVGMCSCWEFVEL